MFRYFFLVLILSTISSFGMELTTKGIKGCSTGRDCPTGKTCFRGNCLALPPKPFDARATARRYIVDHRKTTVMQTMGHVKTTARQTTEHGMTTAYPTRRV